MSSVVIPPPVLGLDLESAPAYVDPKHAQAMENFLIGRNGRAIVRGGHSVGSTTDRNVSITAAWTYVGISNSAADQVLVFGNQTGPLYVYQALDGVISDFASYAGTAYAFDFLPSHARVGAYVYGLGLDVVVGSRVKGGGYSTQLTKIYQWDGQTGIAANFVKFTNGPTRGIAVAAHLERLFVLCYDGTLKWSDTGGPTTDTAAVWQDDVTGLTNSITLTDTNDKPVGLARLGGNLLVLRRRSLWILTGTGPTSFALRRVASVGCTNLNSIVEFDSGVYFLSDQGYIFFDGATTEVVSSPLDTLMRRYASATYDVSAAKLNTGDFVACFANFTTQAPAESFIYSSKFKAWTKLTSQAMNNVAIAPQYVLRTSAAGAVAWDAHRAFSLEDTVLPSNLATTTTDLRTTSSYLVPAHYRSRVIKLATPEYKAAIRKVFVDYDLSQSDVINGTRGQVQWTVSLCREDGTVLIITTLTATATPKRQRAVVEVFGEADAVYVDVQLVLLNPATGLAFAANATLSSSQRPTITSAEIHDVVVAYDEAQPRNG